MAVLGSLPPSILSVLVLWLSIFRHATKHSICHPTHGGCVQSSTINTYINQVNASNSYQMTSMLQILINPNTFVLLRFPTYIGKVINNSLGCSNNLQSFSNQSKVTLINYFCHTDKVFYILSVTPEVQNKMNNRRNVIKMHKATHLSSKLLNLLPLEV